MTTNLDTAVGLPDGLADVPPSADAITSEKIAAAAEAMRLGSWDGFDVRPEEVARTGADEEGVSMAYSAIVGEITRSTSSGLVGMFATAQLSPAGREAFAHLNDQLHLQWNAWCCNRIGIRDAMRERVDHLLQSPDDVEFEDDEDGGEAEIYNEMEVLAALCQSLREVRDILEAGDAADPAPTFAEAKQALSPEGWTAFSLLAEIDAIDRSLLRDQAKGLPVMRYDWTAVKKRLAAGETLHDCYDDMPFLWQQLDELHKASISDGKMWFSVITNVLPRPGANILTPPEPPNPKKSRFWGAAPPADETP